MDKAHHNSVRSMGGLGIVGNYYDQNKHDGFDREVDRKTAEKYLLDSISMFKMADSNKYHLWYFIKLVARFWNHLEEERARLQKWRC